MHRLIPLACLAALAAPAEAALPQERVAMAEHPAAARAVVESGAVRLEVAVAADAAGLHLDYRVDNGGPGPLAVFDQGTNQQPGSSHYGTRHEDGAGITISHRGAALPDPAPIRPMLPLARVVAAGTHAAGRIDVPLPLEAGPRDAAGVFSMARAERLRYCLGVAAFDDDGFVARGEGIWMPTLRVVAEAQRLLCTPWFDTTAGAFVR